MLSILFYFQISFPACDYYKYLWLLSIFTSSLYFLTVFVFNLENRVPKQRQVPKQVKSRQSTHTEDSFRGAETFKSHSKESWTFLNSLFAEKV